MSPARKGQVKEGNPGRFLVTGFPGFLARYVVRKIVQASPENRVWALVEPAALKQAEEELAGTQRSAQVEILSGEVADMHLGLSGDEYLAICSEVTDIFHFAEVSSLDVPRDLAWRVNVEGTRNLIELARDCVHLRRLNHGSTCHISGDRVGVIAEDELDQRQRFRNGYEETKFHAEKMLERLEGDLPVTIYRPGSVVGDSRTGEIDRFEGPYYLGILLVMSPLVVALPLPGDGVAPLNIVPVDFLSDAIWSLSRDERAVGRTFHLVDPNPMSARRAYELIAEKANKRLPRFNFSAKAADMMLRLPLLERIARPHRAALGYVNHLAIYNCRNTLELLEGTGIRCPPLADYLDKLVSYVQEHYRRQRESAVQVEDPLDYALEQSAADAKVAAEPR
jgi:thioester reductase-like protein